MRITCPHTHPAELAQPRSLRQPTAPCWRRLQPWLPWWSCEPGREMPGCRLALCNSSPASFLHTIDAGVAAEPVHCAQGWDVVHTAANCKTSVVT